METANKILSAAAGNSQSKESTLSDLNKSDPLIDELKVRYVMPVITIDCHNNSSNMAQNDHNLFLPI